MVFGDGITEGNFKYLKNKLQLTRQSMQILKMKKRLFKYLDPIIIKFEESGTSGIGTKTKFVGNRSSNIASLQKIQEMDGEVLETKADIKSTPKIMFLSNQTSRNDSRIEREFEFEEGFNKSINELEEDKNGPEEDKNQVQIKQNELENEMIESAQSEEFNIFGKNHLGLENDYFNQKKKEDSQNELIVKLKKDNEKLRKRLEKYENKTSTLEKMVDSLAVQIQNCFVMLSMNRNIG